MSVQLWRGVSTQRTGRSCSQPCTSTRTNEQECNSVVRGSFLTRSDAVRNPWAQFGQGCCGLGVAECSVACRRLVVDAEAKPGPLR